MFIIERIRNKDGSTHEREARRKGHRIYIAHVEIGNPLVAVYVDDGDKILRTSSVEAYNSDWREERRLIVQTENSVYVFRKEGA